MTTFIFMRHGETKATRNDIVSGGGTDAELTTVGLALIEKKVLELHQTRQIDVCLTSGMKRTIPFGDAISFLNPRTPVFHDPRLKEKYAGIFEGAKAKQLRDNGLMERYWEPNPIEKFKMFTSAPPLGESPATTWIRLSQALFDWSKFFPEKTILVGSHTDVIRILKGLAKNTSNNDLTRFYSELLPHHEPKNEDLQIPVGYCESFEIQFNI